MPSIPTRRRGPLDSCPETAPAVFSLGSFIEPATGTVLADTVPRHPSRSPFFWAPLARPEPRGGVIWTRVVGSIGRMIILGGAVFWLLVWLGGL